MWMNKPIHKSKTIIILLLCMVIVTTEHILNNVGTLSFVMIILLQGLSMYARYIATEELYI